MKKAFLSSLGMMGRRHLLGLVRAGFEVTAYDPDENAPDTARIDLKTAGLNEKALKYVDQIPEGKFDLAIFSETSLYRFENLSAFLEKSSANKILLEKPLSSDPEIVDKYKELFAEKGVATENVYTNFPRRHWPYIEKLRDKCIKSDAFELTVAGGAFGFGCNGIHYLDVFLLLSDAQDADIKFVELSPVKVASGRGNEFWDFGGSFLLETSNGRFYCSSAPDSSASTVLTIRGDHFVGWVDESDRLWRLRERDQESSLPNYRYGGEYRTLEEGNAEVPPLDVVTERWALGDWKLPTLEEGLKRHDLLHRILEQGGAKPPYSYT